MASDFKKRTSLGFTFALLVGVASTVQGFMVKYSPSSLTSTDILFFRCLAISLVLLPFTRGDLIRLGERGLRPVWYRAIFGCLGLVFLFYNLRNDHVSVAITLHSLSPFFVVAISAVLFKERLTKLQLLAISAAIIAVGLLKISTSNIDQISPLTIGVGLLGSFFAGSAFVALKVATYRVGAATPVFLLSVITSFVLIPFCNFEAILDSLNSVFLWMLLIASLCAQILLTLSMRHTQASISTTLTRSSVIWATSYEFIGGQVDGLKVVVSLIVFLCLAVLCIPRKSPDIGGET